MPETPTFGEQSKRLDVRLWPMHEPGRAGGRLGRGGAQTEAG